MSNKHWKRDYAILWAGQAVSILTSSVLQMALIWHLTAVTGSAFILSMAMLAGFLPNAVLGAVAGTLVDRISRKLAMIGADLFIAAVSLALVFAALQGNLPTWLIMTVLAVRSIGTAFHTPAISAATPLIVPAEALTKCAGYTQSLQNIGYIAGTAIASVVYPIWTISGIVMLDVGGALIASLAVAVIKIPKPERKAPAQKTNIMGEMKEGYDVLKKEKGLFAILWTSAAFMILYSPIGALFPLMSLDYFGGTTTHASIAEITFSVGMLICGVVVGMNGGFKNRGFGICFSVALMGVAIALSGLLPPNGFWGFAALCVIMGISVPLYNAPSTALFQERISPEYLGRVFGLYGSVCSMAMPVGLLLSAAFADKVGTPNWFIISGVLILVLAVVMYLMPSIRRIDEAGAEAAEN